MELADLGHLATLIASVVSFLTALGVLLKNYRDSRRLAKKDELNALREIIDEIKEENERLRSEIQELRAENVTLRKRMHGLEEENVTLRAMIADLKQENSELKQALKKE